MALAGHRDAGVAEAAQVIADGPAVPRQGGELRVPHGPVKAEPMDQYERDAGARFLAN
jgi:hypothetical protein